MSYTLFAKFCRFRQEMRKKLKIERKLCVERRVFYILALLQLQIDISQIRQRKYKKIYERLLGMGRETKAQRYPRRFAPGRFIYVLLICRLYFIFCLNGNARIDCRGTYGFAF